MSKQPFNGFRLASRLISLAFVSWLAIVNPEIKFPANSGKNSTDLVLSGEILLQPGQSRYIQATYSGNTITELLGFKFAQKPQAKPVFASRVISRPQTAIQASITPPSPAPVVASNYDELFTKYSTMYGVDERKLKAIANCESHYNPGVQSKNGLYGGMYQYSASTWSSTRAAMGADPNPGLRFDAEAAIMTSAWKIAHGGIGAWPVCGKK